jgi:hypothetical protein
VTSFSGCSFSYVPIFWSTDKVCSLTFDVPTIRDEITKFSVKYGDKMTTYTNELASTLLEEEESKRLKRFRPTYLNNQIFVNIISQICERML